MGGLEETLSGVAMSRWSSVGMAEDGRTCTICVEHGFLHTRPGRQGKKKRHA